MLGIKFNRSGLTSIFSDPTDPTSETIEVNKMQLVCNDFIEGNKSSLYNHYYTELHYQHGLAPSDTGVFFANYYQRTKFPFTKRHTYDSESSLADPMLRDIQRYNSSVYQIYGQEISEITPFTNITLENLSRGGENYIERVCKILFISLKEITPSLADTYKKIYNIYAGELIEEPPYSILLCGKDFCLFNSTTNYFSLYFSLDETHVLFIERLNSREVQKIDMSFSINGKDITFKEVISNGKYLTITGTFLNDEEIKIRTITGTFSLRSELYTQIKNKIFKRCRPFKGFYENFNSNMLCDFYSFAKFDNLTLEYNDNPDSCFKKEYLNSTTNYQFVETTFDSNDISSINGKIPSDAPPYLFTKFHVDNGTFPVRYTYTPKVPFGIINKISIALVNSDENDHAIIYARVAIIDEEGNRHYIIGNEQTEIEIRKFPVSLPDEYNGYYPYYRIESNYDFIGSIDPVFGSKIEFELSTSDITNLYVMTRFLGPNYDASPVFSTDETESGEGLS